MIGSIDFETTGLNFYAPKFEVLTCAFSVLEDNVVRSYCVHGEREIFKALMEFTKIVNTCVVHNLQFELGVLKSKFPGVVFNEMWDTMRLVQVADAGDRQPRYQDRYTAQGGVPRDGKGLESCVTRWLPERYHNHKAPYYEYLRGKGVPAGSEGKYLHQLPQDMLESYNVLDTESTLRLYLEIINVFKEEGYSGYILDHQLYRVRCGILIQAYKEGVNVDRVQAMRCIDEMSDKLQEMERKFFDIHADDIKRVIQMKQDSWIHDPKVKTEGGRERRRATIESGQDFSAKAVVCTFNINSTKDLFLLYNGVLGIKPPFYTKPDKHGNGGGSPSFRKNHLKAWHPSGELLQEKGTCRLQKRQAESLLQLSKHDGKWHLSQNPTATKTGRLGGGTNNE